MRGLANSVPRTAWLALILVIFAASAEAAPAISAAESITVRLYDYASINRTVLAASTQVASGLLANAGVGSRWEQCRTSEQGANLSPSCADRADSSVLQLRIQTERQAKRLELKVGQFGYALPTADGHGVIAGVFLGKVSRVARAQGLDVPVLLGHIMAHELGHLLLGSCRHGFEGIMRPSWTNRDLMKTQAGGLRFTSAEASRMQAQVVARTSVRSVVANRLESSGEARVLAPVPLAAR